MKRSGKRSSYLLRLLGVAGLLLLMLLPVPAFSQQGDPTSQNLIVNGGFEQGFQEEFGVAYGWGGFSNGSAVVGWNSETWEKAVAAGEHAQSIEIKNAAERDRYAGIYQTVRVVPGQQYRLTIKGLIRSEEGSIDASNYGYRLQYAVDYNGGTAWELVSPDQWQEIPWDEQPLYEPAGDAYRVETFETTLTARSDLLTLFIRGWKKWINNGSGIYNLDEISLVGPAPAGFQVPAAQAVAGADIARPAPGEESGAGPALEQPEPGAAAPAEQPAVQADSALQPRLAPQETETALPVSGQGPDDSVNTILTIGVLLLLALFGNAILATVRRRRPVE